MSYDQTQDHYSGQGSPSAPARMAAAVTPSDTVDLQPFAKALYVGVSGDVTIVPAADSSAIGVGVLFKAVPVGWFPVQVRRVMATGTTATNITALFDR